MRIGSHESSMDYSIMLHRKQLTASNGQVQPLPRPRLASSAHPACDATFDAIPRHPKSDDNNHNHPRDLPYYLSLGGPTNPTVGLSAVKFLKTETRSGNLAVIGRRDETMWLARRPLKLHWTKTDSRSSREYGVHSTVQVGGPMVLIS